MDGASLRLLLPRQLRELPADLAAVFVLVLVTNLAVLLPVVRQTPLRIVFGLPFVLFLPGYAFIAALFPEAGSGPDADADEGTGAAGTDGADADTAGADSSRGHVLKPSASTRMVSPMFGGALPFTAGRASRSSTSDFPDRSITPNRIRRLRRGGSQPQMKRFCIPYAVPMMGTAQGICVRHHYRQS